jgi:hypothetical protein
MVNCQTADISLVPSYFIASPLMGMRLYIDYSPLWDGLKHQKIVEQFECQTTILLSLFV